MVGRIDGRSYIEFLASGSIVVSAAFVAGVNSDGLSITRFPAAMAVTTGISDKITG